MFVYMNCEMTEASEFSGFTAGVARGSRGSFDFEMRTEK